MVRGYVVTDPEVLGAPTLAADVTAVEVPSALFAGFAISGSGLYPTERGTILVLGPAITDSEALATLRLPISEAAVEVHLDLPAILTKQKVPA
ncbi:MAG: hypothetical protein ACRDTH_06495 [Pseudonocardiaceae bacterium]